MPHVPDGKLPAHSGPTPPDAVAIVGIGCCFPGARGTDAFWRILRDGVETTCDYPGGRLPYLDSVYSAGSGIATRRGGFLRGLDRFDAEFFGISPREASLLDPQQRLLLEVAWEAVEDAGIPAEKIAGSRTGVFVGLWNSDYEECLHELPGDVDFYATTGGGRYPASGRLAYFLDLRGPNLTVDTACSSSLVAIHLACQSLRQGESEMALAGGVNVILRSEITLAYSAAKMLSPDGRSRFGDAAANGYVRSEGAALVLLKPLSRALADGDPIYALIRGSAVNNDGRSSGLLISPSREGQQALLRGAFRHADVDPGEIDYIEAHGTGTLVGDPVEIESIGRVVDTPLRRRPCSIGSVKTNIGHTESAAGVAGVIKVALSVERGIVPASLHLSEPNPAIAWNELPVVVERATAPWPHAQPVRLAGVSGFGITGTNAHIVLENFRAAPQNTATEAGDSLFVLSAHSARALEDVAAAWCERLQSDPAWPVSLADLAYTAAARRTHQEFRLAATAGSRTELERKLSAWLKKEHVLGLQVGRRSGIERGRTVFVFPGQGGQWPGMARGLMGEPVFRDALAECDAAIRTHAGWSVTDRLTTSGAEPPKEIDVIQPCLFAVMVALAALWRSWGIEPEAVVGHSMGEAAAAAVSGALSIGDAAAVICHRSRLMKRASGRGLMALVELPMEEAAAMAREYRGRISVAANNSPTSSVLSGDTQAIEDAILRLDAREVFCRRIKVDVASHCAHMEPFQRELAQLLRGIRPRAGSIPLYSTTTGRVEDGSGLDGEYWSRNLRQPVLFASAVENLLLDGFDAFIEINAHPVLLQSIEDGAEHSGKRVVTVPSLRRDQPERAEMLNSFGTLYVSGFPVDFRKLYPAGVCLRLPTYPWQRERHWIEAEASGQARRSARPAAIAADYADDVYQLRWTDGETLPATSAPAGLWILVTGGDATAIALAARLESSGDECICVADSRELKRVLEASGGCCRGVIRFPRTKSADARDASVEASEIVSVVRAVAGAAVASPTRLWLLSTGVWYLPGDTGEICAAQSPAWGLGLVIAREHPELCCVNLDLSASRDAEEIETVARLLRYGGPEEQIAVRGRKSFVARYERVAVAKDAESLRFRADSTYLITGGLGGIGLNVARWMASLGVRHIALAGRRPPTDAARQRIAAVESLGADVRVFSADLADDTQVADLLHTMRAEMPPLRGIFHLAAITDAVLLGDLDAESLDRVMRPKAAAGWNLHRHLADADLDFFVLFSSIAAALSQPGLGSYAAANAYVDALARYRRARGLKAQSIQWGSWLSTGLSNDENVERGVQVYGQMGIRPVAVEGALHTLDRIMKLETPGVLVLPVSWEQFAKSFENAEPPRAFLRLLPGNESATALAPVKSIREKLLGIGAGGNQRRAALETHLQENLAAILKTDAARIDPAKPFGSMGVDSLMALEFVRRLASTTSLRLPATVVFNYPTIQALARETAKRMLIPLDGQEAAVHAPAARPMRPIGPMTSAVSMVTTLTDEEAIEVLMGRTSNGR